jgi:hypothetical protein
MIQQLVDRGALEGPSLFLRVPTPASKFQITERLIDRRLVNKVLPEHTAARY